MKGPQQYTLQVRVPPDVAPYIKSRFIVLAMELRRMGHSPVVFSDDFFLGHQHVYGAVSRVEDTEFMGGTG